MLPAKQSKPDIKQVPEGFLLPESNSISTTKLIIGIVGNFVKVTTILALFIQVVRMTGIFQISGLSDSFVFRLFLVILAIFIAVEVSAGWHTIGKGDQDKQVVSKKIFNEIKSDVITTFALYLPTTAPPTYKGRLIQINWEVKLTIYNRGFLGKFGNQTEDYFAALRVLPMDS